MCLITSPHIKQWPPPQKTMRVNRPVSSSDATTGQAQSKGVSKFLRRTRRAWIRRGCSQLFTCVRGCLVSAGSNPVVCLLCPQRFQTTLLMCGHQCFPNFVNGHCFLLVCSRNGGHLLETRLCSNFLFHGQNVFLASVTVTHTRCATQTITQLHTQNSWGWRHRPAVPFGFKYLPAAIVTPCWGYVDRGAMLDLWFKLGHVGSMLGLRRALLKPRRLTFGQNWG